MSLLYLTNQPSVAPFPTTSRLLSTSVAGSVVQLGPGKFSNAAPGNARAGQVKPGVALADGVSMPELDSTAGVPGVGRIGWVYPFEQVGKLLTRGRWELGVQLRANAGSGLAGRLLARVSVVRAVGGAWETVKQVLATRITGEVSHTVGQVGWRDSELGTVSPTGTAGPFRATFGGDDASTQAHAFQAGEYLLLEIGYGGANNGTDRVWRFDYNIAAAYLKTPALISVTPDPVAVRTLADPLGENDLSCVDDISPDGAVASGRLALAQALCRRWSTDRGQLIDDPNYGENLTDNINDDMSPADVSKTQAKAAAEALKDERVLSIRSDAELTDEGVLNIEFTVTDAAGPFSLSVAVTDVTVTLLKVDET